MKKYLVLANSYDKFYNFLREYIDTQDNKIIFTNTTSPAFSNRDTTYMYFDPMQDADFVRGINYHGVFILQGSNIKDSDYLINHILKPALCRFNGEIVWE